MRPITLLLLLIKISLVSCRKPIEQGKMVYAEGVVFDPVKNKPLPYAKLYLFGAHSTFYGIHYTYGPFDSITTDNNGKFSLLYKAEGSSLDYGLMVGQLEYGGYNYRVESNYVVYDKEPMFAFKYSTHITNAVVKARELNYTKINLKVLSNPYNTFIVNTSTSNRQSIYIKGTSIDTSIIIRHLPNQQNIIYYRAEGNSADSFFLRRETRDTINATMADTLFITKTVNSIYDMPKQ